MHHTLNVQLASARERELRTSTGRPEQLMAHSLELDRAVRRPFARRTGATH